MLSAKQIVESRDKPTIEIPSFGIKDFEPDGSWQQSREIENSIFDIKNIISHGMVKLRNSLSQAIWHPELHVAEVTHQIGSCWSYMGHKVGQKLYIYPEEALYLLETGSLQIIYNGVSLSVQRAYFVLLNNEKNVSIEKYRVYSLLSGYGYKVLRHSSQNTVTKYEKQLEVHKLGLKLKDYNSSKKTEKRQQELEIQSQKINKKLKVNDTETFSFIGEIYSEDDTKVLKKAQVIQPYDNNDGTYLKFDFDVYSEASEKSFKKSCLQLPHFRIIIHSGENSVVDVEEFCKLSNKHKDEVPVIHAIVFFDCVTFYKVDPVCLPDILTKMGTS